MPANFSGLDLLATAVVALDAQLVIRYANPAAENLLETGARSLRGLFEELIAPILYRVPDERDIERVTLTSIFAEPAIVRKAGVP